MSAKFLFQLFQLLAGAGLFLFAMYLIEDSLKNLSGRKFKLFLQRMTKNSLSAVLGGTVVTGILQSSSMVSLMVLAFVGAGVFTLKNAFAVILGANLGTTLDSWLVATLGFKTNIEVIAYPAVFIGGLLLITFSKREKIKYLSYFLLGFGLLFISLTYMKSAMTSDIEAINFATYAKMPLVFFLLVGFLITLIVQSSSVTMALTLTALHVDAIDLPNAAAIVLGSETGTTIKLLLSGIGGTADKKRVVLGNLLFNIFLTVFAFIFIRKILFLITDVFEVTDPLLRLVTFSSLINLFSVLIFLPFLPVYSTFLMRFFTKVDASIAAFIGNAIVNEPQTAIDLLRRESHYFITNCMLFNLEVLTLPTAGIADVSEFKQINARKHYIEMPVEEKYSFLKVLQGEIQSFYLVLRAKLSAEQSSEINQLMAAVRQALYASKSMHDSKIDIDNLGRSSKDLKYEFLQSRKKETKELYEHLHAYISNAAEVDVKQLQAQYQQVELNFKQELSNFYKAPNASQLGSFDLTTVINFNRELFSSNKAIVLAMKELVLDEKAAAEFEVAL